MSRDGRDYDLERLFDQDSAALEEAEPRIAPGKVNVRSRALLGDRVSSTPGKISVTSMMPVQRRARRGEEGSADHETAATGVAGAGSSLPHFDEIQAAFGRHDLSGVRAHVGDEAAGAARRLGARAYATGSDIAFAEQPDLHTTAHEAAHVVQQRGGVQLAGGFGREGDRYEQHADAVADAVVRGEFVQPLLDKMATPAAARGRAAVQRVVQLDPNREDEVRVGNDDTPRTHVLSNSTHRFAALMHIYESGDFGTGGLTPATVVGRNGETLEQLYQMYRRGEIASTNAPNSFRPGHAAEMVEGIRENGFVSSQAEAERLGIASGQDRDNYSPINVEPVAEGQDPGPSIDQRLSVENSIRGFIVNGHTSGRAANNERRNRTHFLENLQHDGSGNWTHRDGSPLSDEETEQLRTHLASDAERTGALRGEALAAYREHLTNTSNPPLDAQTWVASESVQDPSQAAGGRQPDEIPPPSDYRPDGTRISAAEREQARATADNQEFHRRVDEGDYAGAVRQVEEGGPRPVRPATDGIDQVDAPDPVLPVTEDLDTTGSDPEFHRRVEDRDYAGAVRHVDENRPATRTNQTTTPIAPPTGYDPQATETRADGPLLRRAPNPIHNDTEAPTVGSINAGNVRNEDSGRRQHPAAGTEPSVEYSPTASQGDVGPGGQLSAERRDPDGNARGGGAQVGQHGGELEINQENASGRRRSLAVNVNEQRNADGDVVARDVGVAAGQGPVTGSITGGYTYEVQEAREQADGSFTVAWTVGLRAGGGGSRNVGRAQGGVSGSAGTSRTGTQVFADGSRQENQRRAEAYRTDFENHAVREYERAVGQELGTVDWWIGQPAGTERAVQVNGSISPSAGAAILGAFSVGASGTLRASMQVQVSRGSGNMVTVVQQWGHGEDGSLSAGSFVGVSGGGTHDELVRETYEVDMESGRQTLTRVLDGDGYIEEGQAGARLRGRTTEDTGGSTLGANVMILGEMSGRETTGERREVVYDEEGNPTEQVTQLGEQGFTANNVFGDYARSGLRIEAPEGDGDYQIYQGSHGTEGDESASMLGRAAGEGRAGARAESSGNWVLSETLTQADAQRFHEALIERFPVDGHGPPPGNPVRGVWGDLRSVDIADRAGRARAICAFVSDQGRTGLQIVRTLSGSSDAGGGTQYVRLYGRTGEDLTELPGEPDANGDPRRVQTFLGQERSRALESWIAAHQEGEVSAADITWAEQHMAELDARAERIANVDNFTDMPPEMRQTVLARYRGYRANLAQIIARAGAVAAESMSGDGQEEHRQLETLRQRVQEIEARAESARAAVVGFRRRWGQESSEGLADGSLPAAVDANTRSLWAAAEGAYHGAADAQEEAELRLTRGLRDSQESGEHEQRAAYRSATGSFERAEAFFTDALEQMNALAAIYRPYGIAGPTPEADAGETPEADARETPEADAGESGESGESAAAARPRRRRQRQAAPEPTSSTETTSAARSGPPLIRLPQARMRHCFRFGQRLGEPIQILDPGPIDLPGGGTLFIIRATYERASDYSAVREQLGDDEIFVVHFEVNDPVPGGHATFRISSSLSGPVTNEFGAAVTAYVRAPSNTSGRMPDD